MTPAAIPDYTRSHSITLLAEGDRLVIRADDDLPDYLVEAARAHKPALLAALRCRSLSSDDSMAIREYLEERAAIHEYDGGLSRSESEREARRNMQVFTFRLTDDPNADLILISPASTLDDARRRLAHQFGNRIVEVRLRPEFLQQYARARAEQP